MPLPYTRAPRRAAIPISALPAPEDDEELLPAEQRVLPAVQRPTPTGTTGGLVPQQAGTWDAPAPGRLSDDRNIRAQQSIDRANADFAAKQQQDNPFIFSNDIKSLSKVGGRRYDEAAIVRGEGEYRDQVAGDRAAAVDQRRQQILARNAANSKTMADFEARGVKHYIDPASKLVTPIVDDQGRTLFHATDWEEDVHPKTGTPTLTKRDKYGQRQFKDLPVVPGLDPTDDTMYYKSRDGTLSPAGKIADMSASPNYMVARTALAANKRRVEAVHREALAPMKEELDGLDGEFKQAQGTRDVINQRIIQAKTALENTDDPAQMDALNASVTQLQGQLGQVDSQINGKKGSLTEKLNAARRNYDIARKRMVRDIYQSQIQERHAILRKEGGDPAQDKILQFNQGMLDALTDHIGDGAKPEQPAAAGAITAPTASPLELTEPAALAAQGVKSVGGVALSEIARRYGSQATPASLLALNQRVNELDSTLSAQTTPQGAVRRAVTGPNEVTQISQKLRNSMQAERDYLASLYTQRFARLPEDQQTALTATPEKMKPGSAGGAFARSAGTGVVPALGAWGGFEAGALAGAPLAPQTRGIAPLVTGAIGAFLGSTLADKAQRAALNRVAPDTAAELERLQALDAEGHPIAAAAGALASNLPVFKANPLMAARGLAALAKIARGVAVNADEKAAAKILAMQGGFATGVAVGTPLLRGDKPTLQEVTQGVAQMMLFGDPRFGGKGGARPGERPPLTREQAEAEFARQTAPDQPFTLEGAPSTAEQAAQVLEPALAERANTPPPAKSAAESAQVFAEDAQATRTAGTAEEGAQALVDQLQQTTGKPREDILATRNNPDGTPKPLEQWADELQSESEYQASPHTVDPERRAGELRQELAQHDAEWQRHTDQIAAEARQYEQMADRPDEAAALVQASRDRHDRLTTRREAIDTQLTEADRLRQSPKGGEALAGDLAQEQGDLSKRVQRVPEPVIESRAPAPIAERAAALGAPVKSARESARVFNEPPPPESPVPTPEVPPSDTPAAAPDVPAGEAVADRPAYDALQARMKEMIAAGKAGTPEFNEMWQRSEDIKNRNKGMPPGETAGPISVESTPNTPGEPTPFLDVARESGQLSAPRSAEQRLNDAGSELPPISGMSRAAKRAELDAAGITTYKGKPIDDANPAEISAAVGKLRRGELTPEGENPTTTEPRTSDKIIEVLQRLKRNKSGLPPGAIGFVDPNDGTPRTPEQRLRDSAHDAALDLAILGIRAGRALADVVKLAVQRFKAKFPGATPDDISALTSAIREAHGQPPEPPRPAGPPMASKLAEKWKSFKSEADLKQVISANRDAVEGQANSDAVEKRNEVKDAIARYETDEAKQSLAEQALGFYIESNDGADLSAMRDKIANSDKADSKWQAKALAAIDYATEHGDKLKDAADRYRRITGEQLQAEQDIGMPTLEHPNYVPRYQDVEDGSWLQPRKGGSATGASNRKNRTFATLADSIVAGIDPKTINAVDALTNRVKAGMTGVNLRSWQKALYDTKTPTGEAVSTKPERVEREDGSYYYQAPKGYDLETLANTPVAVHKDYAGLVGALTDPSWWGKNKATVLAQKANANAKSLTLAVDTFHLGRLAFRSAMINASHPSGFKLGPTYKQGLLLADHSPAEITRMAEAGEIPKENLPQYLEDKAILDKMVGVGYNIGQVSDALHQELIQSMPVLGTVNKFIFQQFQRGAMSDAGVLEFKRQKADNPDLTDDQVARKVSKELLTRFGNLGRQGLFKSKGWQDTARMLFLAPQWNEGLIRSELGGVKQIAEAVKDTATGKKAAMGLLGREMLTTGISLFAASQIINQVTRGKFTWENPEEGWGAKMSAWIPDKLGGSSGFFLNPMGLTAETGHLLLNSFERAGNTYDPIISYLRSRASSATRPLWTFLLGKDALGRTLKPDQRWSETAKDSIPAPISGGSAVRVAKGIATGGKTEKFPGEFQKQAMQTFGLRTDKAPSPEGRIQGLAHDFNEKRGIERAATSEVSDYQELTDAVRRGNPEDIQSAIDTLLEKRGADDLEKYYKQWQRRPFTGSYKSESNFLRTLNAEQRQQYSKARGERQRLGVAALRAIAKIPGKKRAGPFAQKTP